MPDPDGGIQSLASLSIARALRLPEGRAHQDDAGEPRIRACQGTRLREVPIEVVFQHVFEQAHRDGHAQVLAPVPSPALDEAPDGLGVGLRELPDAGDDPPARIVPAVLGHPPAGQHALGGLDGGVNAPGLREPPRLAASRDGSATSPINRHR